MWNKNINYLPVEQPKKSWWKRLKERIEFGCSVDLNEVHADFNWLGPLPDKITWKWATEWPIPVMTIVRPPERCPVCGVELEEQWFDYEDIEGESIPMVWARVCPNNHGAFVEAR